MTILDPKPVTTAAIDGVVRDKINQAGSATQVALSATYVSMLPAPTGTDDTAAITAAVSSAAAGTVLRAFRGAAYIVSTVNLNKAVTLDLTGATITQKASTSGDMLLLAGAGAAVRGGVWDGNAANQSASNRGITVSADDCTVRDLTVKNTKSMGVYGIGCNRAIFDGITVSNSGYIGIFVETNGVSIADNIIRNCRVDRSMIAAGTISEGGIKIHGASYAVNAARTNVSGCTVLMPVAPTDGAAIPVEVTYAPDSTVLGNKTINGAMGISLAASDLSTVTGNIVYNANGYGIENAGSRSASITGNIVDGNARTVTGIILNLGGGNNADKSTISGNTVTGFLNTAINVQYAKQVAVTGNTCIGGTGYMINLAQADGSVLVGNVIDGLGAAQKAVMLDSSSRIAVTGNTIRNTTQSGVLAYSAQSSYVIQNVAVSGNIFESVTSPFGTQLSNGATAGSSLKVTGNVGASDWLDATNQVTLTYGTSIPEASAYAGSGTLYMRQNSTQPELYIKGGAANTNTGWKQIVREDRAISGKVLTTGGLGVGNSAAATTPGAVTKKIEVFDAAGASLGFIAVYGSIT